MVKDKDFIPQIDSIEEKAVVFLGWLKDYHSGKSNSIMARDMKAFGIPRVIRKLVHHLRRQGHPICSGCRGYYYGTTQTEVYDSMNFIVNNHKMEAVKGLEKSLLLYA